MADGDLLSACSSSSRLTALLRRNGSGLLKMLSKMLIPRAIGPGFGRTLVGRFRGDTGISKESLPNLGASLGCVGGTFGGPAGKGLTVLLPQGVSGIFLLEPKEPSGSSALRFFLEMSPVDMNADGRGFACL